jgi:hypothetical protein
VNRYPTLASSYKDEIGKIEEPEIEGEDALDVQVGRGEIKGSLRYGVPINITSHLSVRSLEKFRPLSEAWHRFLGLCGPSENDGWHSTDRARSRTSGKTLALRPHDDAEERSRSHGRTREPAWRRLFENASPTVTAGQQQQQVVRGRD